MSEFSIQKIIHEAVKNQADKVYKGIHASGLGGCPRAHYWKIKGYKSTTPPNLGALMNFRMGDVWEDVMFGILKDTGTKVHHHKGEEWSVKELNLFGTPDYSIETPTGLAIVDSKTVNSMWFNYKEKDYKWASQKTGISKQDFLLKENPEYELQQGAYLLIAKHNGLKYDHARLVFVNKDNSFIGWEVIVKLTPELEAKILKRIESLNGFLKANKLPDCECEGWKVGYCDFGNPTTQVVNSKGKIINSECCKEAWVKKS